MNQLRHTTQEQQYRSRINEVVLPQEYEQIGAPMEHSLAGVSALDIQEKVLKAAIDLAEPGRRDGIKVTKLSNLAKKVARLGNHGFRLTDFSCINTDDTSQFEIASVFLVKASFDRSILVPIVMPHNNSKLGEAVRNRINKEFHDEHGVYPVQAMKIPTLNAVSLWYQSHVKDLRQDATLIFLAAVLGIGVAGVVPKVGNYFHQRAVAQQQIDARTVETVEDVVKDLGLATTTSDKLRFSGKIFTEEHGSIDVADRLNRALTHSDENVRARAAMASGAILEAEMQRPPAPFFSNRQNGPGHEAFHLREGLARVAEKDKSPRIRILAIKALEQSIKGDAVDGSLAEDSSSEHHYGSSNHIISKLKDLSSSDPVSDVREAAREAIKAY